MATMIMELNDALEELGRRHRRSRRLQLLKAAVLVVACAAFLAVGLTVGGYIF